MNTIAIDQAFADFDSEATEQWADKVDSNLEQWRHVCVGGNDLGFCHSGCDICQNGLAGDMCEALAQDENGDWNPLQACPDCVLYIASGELPVDL